VSTQPERIGGSLQLGVQKYLYTGYFVAGCVVAFLVSHIADAAWAGHENASNAIGVVAGLAGVFIAWKNIKLRTLAMETIEELAAVTWPSKDETTTATVVVLATAITASVVIFAMDRFWNWITNVIYLS
jgi:preprotein translocase SecE subunit